MKLALAAIAIALASDPQSAVRDPQSAIREPQSRAVTIDVVVSDARGRAVETLKPADFEVREDGVVRSLDDVRHVDDAARVFAIYLDEYHVSKGEASERARAALTTFIDSLGADDRLVVLKPLDSLLKIQFIGDHAVARAIVAAFEGRKGDYAPRTDYERELIAGAPPRVDASRAQVVWSGLDALAVHLGTVAGRRKTILFASEPFAPPARRRGQELLASLDSAIRAANRANVAVYAMNPAAADGGDPPSDPAALRRLAAETDGRFIEGDLSVGLRRMEADARRYYVLTYRSAQPDDGRFHEVQVKVKRPGAVEVLARRGYYDASPDEALGAAILAKLNAPKPATPPEPPPHASPLIRPWFGWSRAGVGQTRVTFVWEPAPPVPGERIRHVPSRLVLTALAPDGKVLFEGPVAPTGAGTIEEPGAVPSRATFDVPPGRVKLRMTIQDAASQPLDRDVRDIVVRDLSGAVAIGTPEVMRARNARELRTLEGSPAVPVVSREFSRAEQLLLRVPVYGSNDSRPEVSVRLLGRSGQTMRQLDAVEGDTNGPGVFTLPLAGLATGEYTIEVTATSASGRAIDRLTFRVTS